MQKTRPAELEPPFEVIQPTTQTTPLVFCSPHSGRVYHDAFLAQSQLAPNDLRKSEDYLIDDLFGEASSFGAPVIAAKFPRAFIDVNREPYELDPYLFEEPLPDYANQTTVRVIGGLGTIARIVADGEEIYDAPLTLHEALSRVELYYKPFHAALSTLLKQTVEKFGGAVLVDCHSMPSQKATRSSQYRPDFVLGDRFGSSCDPELTQMIRKHLKLQAYDVQLNRPYAGGFITEHYGRPVDGINAVQIEINRGLYMDENTLTVHPGFARLKSHLSDLISMLSNQAPALFEGRAAAE